MNKPNKLTLVPEADYDAIFWDGNQIGTDENVPGQMELHLSDEDFENGEFSDTEIDDVLNNLQSIVDYLQPLYSCVLVHRLPSCDC